MTLSLPFSFRCPTRTALLVLALALGLSSVTARAEDGGSRM